MANLGIIIFIILALAGITGLVYIFPSFLGLTSGERGSSHAPSETPEPVVTWISIPENYTSSPFPQPTFAPSIVKVEIGTNNKIMWSNQNFAQMSVLADDNSDPGFFNATHLNGSDSPTAASWLHYGENFEYTFTRAGTYNYRCGFHPWMNGTVIVYPPTK